MARIIVALLLLLPVAASAGSEADAIMEDMETAIHQGVALSAQGAGFIAQAGGRESALDQTLREQGREMIAAGKALVVQSAGGDGMQRLHAMDLSETQARRMMAIHRLESAAMKYLNMLDAP